MESGLPHAKDGGWSPAALGWPGWHCQRWGQCYCGHLFLLVLHFCCNMPQTWHAKVSVARELRGTGERPSVPAPLPDLTCSKGEESQEHPHKLRPSPCSQRRDLGLEAPLSSPPLQFLEESQGSIAPCPAAALLPRC